MINKRLLVKALLAHNNENSFYDKKLKITLDNKEGKAKFLKHICALSNSNPHNNSYLVIGVEDQENKIVGVDFFDDSKIQNFINAYLINPPDVLYENIPFPQLPKGKVVGLVTIKPTTAVTSLLKNIWKFKQGNRFVRIGSVSKRTSADFRVDPSNATTVQHIEKHAQNNIQLTLDGVVDFLSNHKDEVQANYLVFKESFVVCWAGIEKKVKSGIYYSRVDIELINEQVKLFYSTLDEVEIAWTKSEFIITEYVRLGISEQFRFFPLEALTITFLENGAYQINSNLLFKPPQLDKKNLQHLFTTHQKLLDKIENNLKLNAREEENLLQLPSHCMLCYLNEIPEALDQLERSKPILKAYGTNYFQAYKDTQRILRKIKYN
jgi:hypothetical protein